MAILWKWTNFRLPANAHAEYRQALVDAKKQTGRHVFGSDILSPAIDGFVAATKAGRAAEYLENLAQK